MSDFKPKHTVFDKEKFAEERAKLGGLAQEGMQTTGGTDIDWVVEHRGGFIVMENKSQEVEEATNEKGNKVVYKDEFEKYVSNNTEQTINDFLGVNWFRNTVKINSKISLFLNKIRH